MNDFDYIQCEEFYIIDLVELQEIIYKESE